MKNRATHLYVKLSDDTKTDYVIDQILSIDKGINIKKWNELAGIMQSMTDSFRIINQILNLINILIAGITIFIVTYVDLVNRKRQIGIQRAIGIKTHVIILSYVFRALLYAILGIIMGYLVYNYIIIPLELRRPFIFSFGPAYLSGNNFILFRTIILVLTVSVVASCIPVLRVMRKSIIESIWG